MSEPRPPSHSSLKDKFDRRVPENLQRKAGAKAAAEAPRSPGATMAVLLAMMGENNIVPHRGGQKSTGVAQTWRRGVVSLLVMAGMTATVSMAVIKAGSHEKSFVNLTPQVEETINAYFASSGLAVTSADAAGQMPSSAPAYPTEPAQPGDQPGVSAKQPQDLRIIHDRKGRGLVTATLARARAADGYVEMSFDTPNPIATAINHHLTAGRHRPQMKANNVPAWAQYMKPSDAAQLESNLKTTSNA